MRFTMRSFLIGDGGALTLAKSEDIDAPNDTAAVDAARAHHESIVPDEGGDFEIIVDALDPGVTEMTRTETGAYVPRPPGEISRWCVAHEPAEHVREAVYAEREAKAAAAAETEKRAAMRAEILAEIAAEQAQKATP